MQHSIKGLFARIVSFLVGEPIAVPVVPTPPKGAILLPPLEAMQEHSRAHAFDLAFQEYFGVKTPEELPQVFASLEQQMRADPSRQEAIGMALLDFVARADVAPFLMRPWRMVELDEHYAIRSASKFERAFYEQCALHEDWSFSIPYRSDSATHKPGQDYILCGTSWETLSDFTKQTAKEIGQTPGLIMPTHCIDGTGDLQKLVEELNGGKETKDLDKEARARLKAAPPGEPLLIIVAVDNDRRHRARKNPAEISRTFHETALVIALIPGVQPAVQGLLHVNSWPQRETDPYFDIMHRSMHRHTAEKGADDIPMHTIGTGQQHDARDENCVLYAQQNLRGIARIAAETPELFWAQMGLADRLPLEQREKGQSLLAERALADRIVQASNLHTVQAAQENTIAAPIPQLHEMRWNAGNKYLVEQIHTVAPKLGAILEKRLEHSETAISI